MFECVDCGVELTKENVSVCDDTCKPCLVELTLKNGIGMDDLYDNLIDRLELEEEDLSESMKGYFLDGWFFKGIPHDQIKEHGYRLSPFTFNVDQADYVDIAMNLITISLAPYQIIVNVANSQAEIWMKHVLEGELDQKEVIETLREYFPDFVEELVNVKSNFFPQFNI